MGLERFAMTAGGREPLSKMTGSQQTMQTWARVIETWDDVPEVYRVDYAALVGNVAALPYTVLAPAIGGLRGRKPAERLLWNQDGVFHALEWSGKRMFKYRFRNDDICSLEQGNVLLYSWFSLHGPTLDGVPATLTVEFNESTLRHLEPFFVKMRPALSIQAGYDRPVELQKLQHLERLNYKFMGFARRSLMPGERIIQALYQPVVRAPVITVLGRSLYRTLVQPHLSLLMDHEVVLIADAGQASEDKTGRYQGVWRFLPMRHLQTVTLETQAAGLLRFRYHLSDQTQVDTLFDASRTEELEAFRSALEQAL